MSRPQDCSRIDIEKSHEVSYWTKKWDVSRSELSDAVGRVGPTVVAVARELQKPFEIEPAWDSASGHGDSI